MALSAEIKVIDDQLRLAAESDRPGSDGEGENAAPMARLLELYVDAVETLRTDVDAIPARRQKVEANPEVQALLTELRVELKSRVRVTSHPRTRPSRNPVQRRVGHSVRRIALEPGAKAG